MGARFGSDRYRQLRAATRSLALTLIVVSLIFARPQALISPSLFSLSVLSGDRRVVLSLLSFLERLSEVRGPLVALVEPLRPLVLARTTIFLCGIEEPSLYRRSVGFRGEVESNTFLAHFGVRALFELSEVSAGKATQASGAHLLRMFWI